jgi:hypothetical protein
MSNGFVDGDQVGAVLEVASALAPHDGDAQLTMIAIALVVGCGHCGVEKDKVLAIVAQAYDDYAHDQLVGHA